MARTEPNKEDNEVAIRELKSETRGEHPMKYKDARSGLAGNDLCAYRVVAIETEGGQLLQVAHFPFDPFDGNKRRDTARMMAEELVEWINKQQNA